MNPETKFFQFAARLLASAGMAAIALLMSPATASASAIVDNTVGTLNGNGQTIFEAAGSTVNSATFASDIATAFANNTGGVWDFETAAGMHVLEGETVTLNYGTSLSSNIVLTLSEGGGADEINQASNGGEATSGSFVMGLGNSGSATRTFTLGATKLLELGIFNTDRNANDGRNPVLTVTFQDNTTASTSGADADNVFFHGFKTDASNPIVSFSISQYNFVRYDDLGFVAAAVPEPAPAVYLLGGAGMLALLRRRGRNVLGSHAGTRLGPGAHLSSVVEGHRARS